VQAAADVAPADVADSMDRLLRQVTQGRSAADDFADRVVAHGIDSAITGLASDDRLKGGV
jgi:glutamate--cysteine ligase